MIYQRGANKNRVIVSGLIIMLMVLANACDDNPANDDGEDKSGTLTMVEGEINGYDLGSQELYHSEDFVDLIEGSIGAEGAFTVEFLDREAIEEALKPLTDGSEGFVSMYCRESIMESLSSDHLFVGASYFNFTYGEDTNVAGIALSSNGVNRNIYPPQADTDGDYQIRWVYSSQETSISENCSSAEVDLELLEGWNEVIFDVSDRDAKRMYTGDRPAEVEWVIEES